MKFYAENIDVSSPVISGFGNDTIKVTEKYITKNGIAWLPIMGEFHFSRFNRNDWETEIIKMKQSGIEVVASYLLWLHHENVEGVFNWSGNCDLREFISLCQKHSLYFFLRPGPWAHGECRNGGFPNWLFDKCDKKVRCASEPYLFYVKRLFAQISEQVKGLTNIIGIQVENELPYDADYLLAVKKIILESGMNAPIFTATAWGSNPQIPTKELLPVYGGYPEAPWEQHTKVLSPNSHYFFTHERNDSIIGNDLLGHVNPKDNSMLDNATQNSKTPFLTCETGGGIQVTYHRRPIIKANDVISISLTLLGNGCNMLGYYMYHGGQNPIFADCTTQESRNTGYANDYPIVSYDFQAPIGECGQLRESYRLFTKLHSFVHYFGSMLCEMTSIFPDTMPTSFYDNQTLRCAIRTNGRAGFLFVNNYQRMQPLPAHENVLIQIELSNETLNLIGINVAKDSSFILPFNLLIGTKLLKYALVQPFSIEGNVWSFAKIEGMEPHFYFEDCDFILTDNGYKLGNIELRLVESTVHEETKGKGIKSVLTDNVIGFERFEYLKIADNTKEYTIKWEEDFNFLKVNCIGNVAHAYYNKNLIADWFCNGTEWVIDVRNLPTKELIIKIQPLLENDDIYFETAMPIGETSVDVYGITEDTVCI